jgi:hypothetical protein
MANDDFLGTPPDSGGTEPGSAGGTAGTDTQRRRRLLAALGPTLRGLSNYTNDEEQAQDQNDLATPPPLTQAGTLSRAAAIPADVGQPSLLATERVNRAPSTLEADPLLPAAQRLESEVPPPLPVTQPPPGGPPGGGGGKPQPPPPHGGPPGGGGFTIEQLLRVLGFSFNQARAIISGLPTSFPHEFALDEENALPDFELQLGNVETGLDDSPFPEGLSLFGPENTEEGPQFSKDLNLTDEEASTEIPTRGFSLGAGNLDTTLPDVLPDLTLQTPTGFDEPPDTLPVGPGTSLTGPPETPPGIPTDNFNLGVAPLGITPSTWQSILGTLDNWGIPAQDIINAIQSPLGTTSLAVIGLLFEAYQLATPDHQLSPGDFLSALSGVNQGVNGLNNLINGVGTGASPFAGAGLGGTGAGGADIVGGGVAGLGGGLGGELGAIGGNGLGALTNLGTGGAGFIEGGASGILGTAGAGGVAGTTGGTIGGSFGGLGSALLDLGAGAGWLGLGNSLGNAINGLLSHDDRALGGAVGTLGGMGVGAGAGAILGTVVYPGIGTAVGAILGAGIGAAGGGMLGGLFGQNLPHYYAVREHAGDQASAAIDGLANNVIAAGHTGDIRNVQAALAKDEANGHVRIDLNLPPDVTHALNIAPGARIGDLTTQQFIGLLKAYSERDPSLTHNWFVGSGDVGYLNRDAAQHVANSVAGIARGTFDTMVQVFHAPLSQAPPVASLEWSNEGTAYNMSHQLPYDYYGQPISYEQALALIQAGQTAGLEANGVPMATSGSAGPTQAQLSDLYASYDQPMPADWSGIVAPGTVDWSAPAGIFAAGGGGDAAAASAQAAAAQQAYDQYAQQLAQEMADLAAQRENPGNSAL